MKSLVRSEGGVTVSMAGACQEINRERLTGRGKRGKNSLEDTFQGNKKRKKGTTPIKQC